MTTNKLAKMVKGAVVGLAMTAGTVFQANGCSLGVDNLDSVTGLLNSVLSTSDVSMSLNSSPRSTSTSTSSRSDFGDFGYCDCMF